MFVDIVSIAGSDGGHPVDGMIRHGARTAMGRTLVGIEFRRLDRERAAAPPDPREPAHRGLNPPRPSAYAARPWTEGWTIDIDAAGDPR